MIILLLFSIFLSSVVISPIKQLADSAKNIQTKTKSTTKIINLNKRKDEIGDLSKILAEKVESLKDKIEENEEYSADLMHEIRNPLTSIKMATEVMSSGGTKGQVKFINAIQNDVARIETIITDYSIMMKDEALMSDLQNNEIDIQKLLENITLEYNRVNIKGVKLRLITSENIKNNTIVNGSRILASESQNSSKLWRNTPPAIERHFRSSLAYRLCLVAEGRFDGMMTLRPTWEWDVAAGNLICTEAGCDVKTQDGGNPLYNEKIPKMNGFGKEDDAKV